MPLTPLLPTKGWAEHWDNTSPHPITFSVKRGSGEKPHSVPPHLYQVMRRAGSCLGRASGWVPPCPCSELHRPARLQEDTCTQHGKS